MADRHPLLCVCSVFIGLVLRDGVQIYLYIFGFLGPLGLDSGRLTTPFLKCVSSNFSKKTNNPNPSPIKKIWFGLYWFGAPEGTRTHTPEAREPKSRMSTNSITGACFDTGLFYHFLCAVSSRLEGCKGEFPEGSLNINLSYNGCGKRRSVRNSRQARVRPPYVKSPPAVKSSRWACVIGRCIGRWLGGGGRGHVRALRRRAHRRCGSRFCPRRA